MTAVNDVLTRHSNLITNVATSRAWKTSIQSSVNGIEKRSCLYSRPRRAIEFSVLARSAAESNAIRRRLFKNLHNIWGAPVWPDRTVLTATIAPEQTAIPVESTAGRCFEAGGSCILWDGENFEICLISGVTGSEITLTDGVEYSWASNTDIYPMLPARLEPEQNFSIITGWISKISVKAVEVIDGSLSAFSASTDADIYQGLPVFAARPSCSDAQLGLWRPYNFLQFLGVEYAHSDVDETRFKISMQYLALSRSAMADIVDFFDVCKGRWGRLWLPTWQNDIVVTSAFSASATTLTIEDIEWADVWQAGNTTGHYIYIAFPDGTTAIKEILSASDTTHITLNEAIGTACTTADDLGRLMVSFLLLARFDQDSIDIEYITKDVSRIKLKFVSLLEDL